MTYNSSYKKRKELGVKAEKQVFEYYQNTEGIEPLRIGIEFLLGSKTDLITTNFYDCVPNQLKCTPDILLFSQRNKEKKMFFLEVKLSGTINVKIKLLDIEAYKYWNEAFNGIKLYFHIMYFDFKKQKILSFDNLLKLITSNNYKEEVYQNNGKKYILVPYKDL